MNNNHYSSLERLNATPYNFYGSQIFVLVAPSRTSNCGLAQYSNRFSTTTATDQNKNVASQEHSRPDKSRKRETGSTKQAGK